MSRHFRAGGGNASVAYYFSEKGFCSCFAAADSAIHHSQVYENTLFKQCQCIIAQGLKRRSTASQTNISSFPLFFVLLSFSGKMKPSHLCFLLLRLLLCSRTWNWIKHDGHPVNREARLRSGREIEKLTSAYSICRCDSDGSVLRWCKPSFQDLKQSVQSSFTKAEFLHLTH